MILPNYFLSVLKKNIYWNVIHHESLVVILQFWSIVIENLPWRPGPLAKSHTEVKNTRALNAVIIWNLLCMSWVFWFVWLMTPVISNIFYNISPFLSLKIIELRGSCLLRYYGSLICWFDFNPIIHECCQTLPVHKILGCENTQNCLLDKG